MRRVASGRCRRHRPKPPDTLDKIRVVLRVVDGVVVVENYFVLDHGAIKTMLSPWPGATTYWSLSRKRRKSSSTQQATISGLEKTQSNGPAYLRRPWSFINWEVPHTLLRETTCNTTAAGAAGDDASTDAWNSR